MTVVIDASMTRAWYFKDEATPEGAAVLDFVLEYGAFAPVLWRVEVANTLKAGIRCNRIDAAFRSRTLRALTEMPIIIDQDGEKQIWTRTLDLSDRYGLTMYDACYLELADRHRMPLATFDRELIAAGRAHGLSVLAP